MAGIQFKRADAARWEEVNPVLAEGQPGWVMDENRLKIGDGVTPWIDLPYLGEDNVENFENHYAFPSIGRDNVIYKAESEALLYQWNTTALKYEVLGPAAGEGGDLSNIQIIHGGNAAGE